MPNRSSLTCSCAFWLIEGVEAEGWRFVAFVRLVPLFPFNLANYALGLTRISFTAYLIASFICMAPGAIAYGWLGHAGREALAGDASATRYGLMALGLLTAVAFLPRLIRRLRNRATPRWIATNELASRFGGDAVAIIDVRSPEEFIGPLGHIEEFRLPAGAAPAFGRLRGCFRALASSPARPLSAAPEQVAMEKGHPHE